MLTSVSSPDILLSVEGMCSLPMNSDSLQRSVGDSATPECSHTQRPSAPVLAASFPSVLSGWNIVAGPPIVVGGNTESLHVSITDRADRSPCSPECADGAIALGHALATVASSRAAALSPGTSVARGRTESDIAGMLRSSMADLAAMACEECGTVDGVALSSRLLCALETEGVTSIRKMRVCFSPVSETRFAEIDEFVTQYAMTEAVPILRWLTEVSSCLSLQDALAPRLVVRPVATRNLVGHIVVDEPEVVRPVKLLKTMHEFVNLSDDVPEKLLKIVSPVGALSAQSGSVSVSSPVGLASRPVGVSSLHLKYAGLRAKAAQACTALLKRIRSASPLYAPLFGLDGSVDPPVVMLEVFHDLAMGSLEPTCILNYVKEVERFRKYCGVLGFALVGLDELSIAAFLKASRERGKSVPVRVRSALVWCERCLRVPIVASAKCFADFVQRLSKSGVCGPNGSGPAQAPMLSPDVVAKLEDLVSSAPTAPLRIFAGVACLSTHGIKRWSDIQHFEKWSASRDSTVVVSWKSKRKLASLQWAALRIGFSGRDWLSMFEYEMTACGLPAADFFVPRPTVNLKGFTKKPRVLVRLCPCFARSASSDWHGCQVRYVVYSALYAAHVSNNVPSIAVER